MVHDGKTEDTRSGEVNESEPAYANLEQSNQPFEKSIQEDTVPEHRESLSKSPGYLLDTDEDVENQPRELAVLSNTQSNAPPYSVFSERKKHFIVFLAAWGGFFSPLSANIYFPALTTLTREYNVSNTLMNLTLTSYMIFQGLAPTIFGDLADMA